MEFSTVMWSPPVAGVRGVCPLSFPPDCSGHQGSQNHFTGKLLWEAAGQKEGKALVFWPASMSPASSLLPGQVTQKPDRQLPAETGCGATGNHRTLLH